MAAIASVHPLAVRRISMLQIDAVVSAKLGETRGRGRSQPLVFNRQVAMYLASRVGRWSTTAIGRFYNHRDHSTVCYSIQKIEKLRHENPKIAALLTALEQNLDEQHSMAQAESNSMAPLGPAVSESQIELVARSAAEQFYRDFNAALRRPLAHLQRDGCESAPASAPLRSADIHLPTRNRVPQTVPRNKKSAGAHRTSSVEFSYFDLPAAQAFDGEHRLPSVKRKAAYAASSGLSSLCCDQAA